MREKTINELRQEAARKGIPLARSMKKSDILRALEKAKSSRKVSRRMAARPAVKKKESTHPPLKTAPKGHTGKLPEEYGENDLFLIVVDPYVVYASWEIKREDLPGRHHLTMRFFDVTATGPGGMPEMAIEIDIRKRLGSGFFEIKMPGRDVVAEVGFRRGGVFQPVIRSNMVSFPLPMPHNESGMPEPTEPGTPVGY